MMGQATKIQAKDNPKVALRVTKGHFSSDRFHINYYIDMSSLKMRQSEAEAVAKAMVKKYVNRVGLSKSFGISDEVLQYSKAFATKKTIDTIICMDGCEVIGAYVAQQLSEMGFNTTNMHKTSYIITPEFDSTGQMVVRENIVPMLKDKHVLVVLASAMSGHTIMKSIRCIESYGGMLSGKCSLRYERYPGLQAVRSAQLPAVSGRRKAGCNRKQLRIHKAVRIYITIKQSRK